MIHRITAGREGVMAERLMTHTEMAELLDGLVMFVGGPQPTGLAQRTQIAMQAGAAALRVQATNGVDLDQALALVSAQARIAELEQALREAHDVLEVCDGIIDIEEHPDLTARMTDIFTPCDEAGVCPTVRSSAQPQTRPCTVPLCVGSQPVTEAEVSYVDGDPVWAAMTRAEIEQARARLEWMLDEVDGETSAAMDTALACLRDYVPREDRERAITCAFHGGRYPQVEGDTRGIDAVAEARRLLKLEQP